MMRTHRVGLSAGLAHGRWAAQTSRGPDLRPGQVGRLSLLFAVVGYVLAVASPARGQCPTTVCNSNADCSDGLFCTIDQCILSNPNFCFCTQRSCDDGLFCTDDSCNEATDTCDHPAHVCQTPTPFCDEEKDVCAQCLQDAHCTVNPRRICAHGVCVQCNDNGDCQDGSYCNGLESCNFVTGLCQSGTPTTCTKKCFMGTAPPGTTCTTNANCGTGGRCLGFCSNQQAACVQCENDAGCDDGKFCNGAEMCNNGQCVVGTPPVCKRCAGGPDNLQPCSTNADCGSPGTCTGGPSYCDEVSNRCVPCLNSSHCEDFNFCTTNVCVFNACVFTPNPAICSDGLWCNGEEVCDHVLGNPCSIFRDRAHCCFVGTPRNCADSFACTVDSCNETNDSCVSIPNDGNCTDGRGCTGTETCQPGAPGAEPVTGCLAGSPFDCSAFESDCSVGNCLETPTVRCVAQAINQGVKCNDNDPCSADSKCNNAFCVNNPPAPNDPYRCVKLEWRPSNPPPVLAGSVVELRLYAVADGCNTPTPDCPTTSLEVASIDALFSWNKTFLQLQPSTGPDPNPADPCVRADSCRVCPADQYPWGFSGWTNDCGPSGDCLNQPGPGGVPANDGNARYLGFQAPVCSLTCRGGSNDGLACCLVPPCFPPLVDCPNGFCSDLYCVDGSNDGLPCSSLADCPAGRECTNLAPPACATTTGLHVTTIKFKAVSGGTSQIAFLPCFGTVSKTGVQSPIVTNAKTSDVTKFLGSAVTVTVTCDSIDDCNDNNVCTNDTCSCTTPSCGGSCSRVNNTNFCNDGLFCTVTDRCGGGVCVGTGSPCSGGTPYCDEARDQCVPCLTDANCNTDGLACTIDQCIDNGTTHVCQRTPVNCSDGVACTTDACVEPAGTCTHVANNTFCNPINSFCSSAVCDPQQDCVLDHECISTNGNPCPDPATCNEATDTCGGCRAPTVTAAGCRYLNATPLSQGSTPVALLVTGDCGDPNVACAYRYVQSKCNGGANNGQNCNTNADCPKTCVLGLNPGAACVAPADCPLGTCVGKCDAGTLGATPYYKLSSEWGTAKIRGTQIRPGTTYMVHTECNFVGGPVLSSAGSAATWRWGDIDNDTDVDALDITSLVNGFKGLYGPYTFEQFNIWACTPDLFLDALDIASDVDAFKGFAFSCPIVCP